MLITYPDPYVSHIPRRRRECIAYCSYNISENSEMYLFLFAYDVCTVKNKNFKLFFSDNRWPTPHTNKCELFSCLHLNGDKGTVSRGFSSSNILLKRLYLSPTWAIKNRFCKLFRLHEDLRVRGINDYADKCFCEYHRKIEDFAKPVLPVHMGPGWSF